MEGKFMRKKVAKTLGLLVAATMICTSLAACGSSEGGSDSSSEETTEDSGSQTAEGGSNGGTKKLAVMMHSVADDFIYCCGKHAQEYGEEMGYDVTFYDADNEADTQASQICAKRPSHPSD